MRGEVWAGRRVGREAAAAQVACTGRDRLITNAQGTGGAHLKHLVHVRDAGRVEAQWLVKRLRVLPSRKVGMRCEARCGLEGGRGMRRRRRKWRERGSPCTCLSGDRLIANAQGTGGAHHKHSAHVRDAGRVEAQWLVEHRPSPDLPSRKEGIWCGVRCDPGGG